HMAENGAVRVAITAVDQELRAGSVGGGNVVLVTRRVCGSRRDSWDGSVCEEATLLERWVRVMQELAIDAELGSENVIYLHHVFAEIKNVAQGRDEPKRVGGSDEIGRGKFGKDIGD